MHVSRLQEILPGCITSEGYHSATMNEEKDLPIDDDIWEWRIRSNHLIYLRR